MDSKVLPERLYPQTTLLSPLRSPAFEDVPIWNILPSYQLFQSTFAKGISPQAEDPNFDPPQYDVSDQPTASDGYFPIMNDVGPTRWEDSILGNTHRLKRLIDIDTPFAEQLLITLALTRSACVRGVAPDILDHKQMEFCQGDSIHGYLLVKNNAKVPLPYNMFSVVLEGKVSVTGDSPKKPLVFHKFLNMFDYSALWTPVDVQDDPENHKEFDRMDGTWLSFPMNRYFEPGITYKKFFNFTLPEKLLDCACDNHNLGSHCEMLPSVGLARDEFLQSVRKLRDKGYKGHFPLQKANSSSLIPLVDLKKTGLDLKKNIIDPKKNNNFLTGIRDYSFSDTAISYSIEARVVGKTEDYYELTDRKHKTLGEKREFFIVNDGSCFFRFAPRERDSADELISMSIYRNLMQRISQKIELGQELINIAPKRANSIVKSIQVGAVAVSGSEAMEPELHHALYPFKKKSLTAPPKVIGMVSISTPKEKLSLPYISPFESPREQHLQVPIDLSYIAVCQKGQGQHSLSNGSPPQKAPEIKGISAELIIITYRSKKYPIPVEITNKLVYLNTEEDGLEAHVVNPMKKKLGLLAELMNRVGSEPLSVDNQLVMDMKSLAQLQVKQNALKFIQVKVDTPSQFNKWDSQNGSIKMNITIDTQKFKDTATDFTLVPNFQSCIIGRTYFINVIIKLAGESFSLKIPLSVEK